MAEIQVRRHVLRKFELGTVFRSEGKLWVAIERKSEDDGHGDVLTLERMTREDEIVWTIMED